VKAQRTAASRPPAEAGMKAYLKRAFLLNWNLLALGGGVAAAILSPWPDAVLPLVLGLEGAYLASIVSFPRFRKAIDASLHQSDSFGPEKPPPQVSAARMIAALSPEARSRFSAIRTRCLDMHRLAHGARGHAGSGPDGEMRSPALDRLLWVFLRLLVTRGALRQFLDATDEAELQRSAQSLRTRLEAAPADERIRRSLADSLGVAELRLDNYAKAKSNADFVEVELERIEAKIQALTEMAINRQDPDFLSSQVDAAAESMQFTESTISDLQYLTGMSEELDEPPPILSSRLDMVADGDR
jgi:hypothetical protein